MKHIETNKQNGAHMNMEKILFIGGPLNGERIELDENIPMHTYEDLDENEKKDVHYYNRSQATFNGETLVFFTYYKIGWEDKNKELNKFLKNNKILDLNVESEYFATSTADGFF